ncbi:MAG: arginine--tRNA ligase [Methylophilaceae bacterium]|nr:arginine--tRNA ligase [Methylophilaceae bacterium]NCV27353.1 arginine--tRNA ligase [Nitrosomonadales bacterium]NCW62648.1 arginine--tRNA ligase [Betaproteobacteria bacterium]
MKTQLASIISLALDQILDDSSIIDIHIERPKTLEHGDYSTNIALQLTKILKKNPREIAQLIIEKIGLDPSIDRLEIAGPGFINFYLSAAGKSSIIKNIFTQSINYGHNEAGKNQKLQVEFVSANPTGPLHIGHGRGAAIGDSLARIMQANGWDVTREFYYNDAGQQINNLALSVQSRIKGIEPDDTNFPEDGYRGEYILEIADAYSNCKTVEVDGEIVKSNGNPDDVENIKKFSVAFLRKEQNIDLDAFQTTFDVFTLESTFYQNKDVEKVLDLLEKNGFSYKKDDATWLKTTTFGDDKDRVMIKTDGSYTYFVPDVAYHLNKWERGFVRVINEQGADHHSTITRVRAGLQGLNLSIPKNWPEYVLHQMVTVTKNNQEVKISKRAGSYVTLRDLIDEVGSDATRYFLLARKPDSQLIFDIDLAKSQTNDNPVYYIQYAHARICAVLNQVLMTKEDLHNFDESLLTSTHEHQLIKRLSEFPEIILLSASESSPHYIATFLKDLAADFHSYYNANKFLSDDKALQNARLALIGATKIVIKNGLQLLGISAPEKM